MKRLQRGYCLCLLTLHESHFDPEDNRVDFENIQKSLWLIQLLLDVTLMIIGSVVILMAC